MPNPAILCLPLHPSLLSLLLCEHPLDLFDGPLHLADLRLYCPRLLGVLCVNHLEVLLRALPKPLCVPQRGLHVLRVLHQRTLHQRHTLQITQMLRLLLDQVPLCLDQVIRDSVDLMQGIVTESIKVILVNFVINLLKLSLLVSSLLLRIVFGLLDRILPGYIRLSPGKVLPCRLIIVDGG